MMKSIKYGNTLYTYDDESTKEYYKTSTLCNCEQCRLYSDRISGRFPELEAFLSSFGIDIKKPDETSPIETGEGILYDMVGYTACGKIESGADEILTIDGLKISFCNGFDFPNEQTQPYFSITVNEIYIT